MKQTNTYFKFYRQPKGWSLWMCDTPRWQLCIEWYSGYRWLSYGITPPIASSLGFGRYVRIGCLVVWFRFGPRQS